MARSLVLVHLNCAQTPRAIANFETNRAWANEFALKAMATGQQDNLAIATRCNRFIATVPRLIKVHNATLLPLSNNGTESRNFLPI